MKKLLFAAPAVGAAAGAASAAFLRLYERATFWPATPGVTLPRVLLVVLPALGGLACGAVLELFEPAARGTGTPELLHAVRGRGARPSGMGLAGVDIRQRPRQRG